MIDYVFVMNLILGAFGAVMAEGLQIMYSLAEGRRVQRLRAVIIAVFGTLFTPIYFHFAGGSYGLLAPCQYAVFVVLFIETVRAYFDSQFQPPTVKHPIEQARATDSSGGIALSAAPIIPGLILHGWIQVMSVGCFGALIAEIHRLRAKRKPQKLWPIGWIWSAVVVLTSGVVTILHGASDVSALTAVQLGAAGPLVVSRIRIR